MPNSTTLAAGVFVISLPYNSTEPPVIFSNPSTAFIAVDLPAPFGPIMATISLGSIKSDKSCRISVCPYPARRLLSDKIGIIKLFLHQNKRRLLARHYELPP